jgi:hypothetical protein
LQTYVTQSNVALLISKLLKKNIFFNGDHPSLYVEYYFTELIGISLIAKIDRFPSLGSEFLCFSEISVVTILNIQMAVSLSKNIAL